MLVAMQLLVARLGVSSRADLVCFAVCARARGSCSTMLLWIRQLHWPHELSCDCWVNVPLLKGSLHLRM